MTKTTTNGAATSKAKKLVPSSSLRDVRDYLNAQFAEREGVVDALLTTAVSGENMVMLGPPGVAKSALARQFAACIGGSYYEYLFTRFSQPDEFIGPLSVKSLTDHDEYRRVIKGKLADCDVAFLDEVFKSNSPSLNTLLPILNERTYDAKDIPLRLVIAASNEMPAGEDLGAMWDRILIRSFVEPLRSEKNRARLLSRSLGGSAIDESKRPSMTMAHLDQSRAAVRDVKVSKGLIKTLLQLRRELEQKGITYGDRRWVKALHIIRSFAVVLGDNIAENAHITILCDVLWSTEDQRELVREIVMSKSAPELRKAEAALDAVLKNVDGLVGSDAKQGTIDDVGKACRQLTEAGKRIKSELTKLSKGTTSHARVEAMLDQIRARRDLYKTELMSRVDGDFLS